MYPPFEDVVRNVYIRNVYIHNVYPDVVVEVKQQAIRQDNESGLIGLRSYNLNK